MITAMLPGRPRPPGAAPSTAFRTPYGRRYERAYATRVTGLSERVNGAGRRPLPPPPPAGWRLEGANGGAR